MDDASKNLLVFDQNLKLLQTAGSTGHLTTVFANKKPKPLPIPKPKVKRSSSHRDQAKIAQYAQSSNHAIPRFSKLHMKPQPKFLLPQPSSFQSSSYQQREPKGSAPYVSQDRVERLPSQTKDHAGSSVSVTHKDVLQDDNSDLMEMSSGSEPDNVDLEALEAQSVDDNMVDDNSPVVAFTWDGQEFEVSDGMDLSSGPDADEESDGAAGKDSREPSNSLTPSRDSGPSSNTSTGIHNEARSFTELSQGQINAFNTTSRSSSLSSQLSPAKSTSPAALKPLIDKVKTHPKSKSSRPRPSKEPKLVFSSYKPRTSIPHDISPTVLAQQGIQAAFSSRLNPYFLHPEEYRILKDHICHLHVSAYLNIRNRILRLWVRNPLVSVTLEEAAGCAMASRWLGLAEVAFDWLVRRGYINFGCVEIPEAPNERTHKVKRLKKKTIVVVGAGMAGLGCARQLEGLLRHYRHRWTSMGDEPPNVVLLEGRNRIGGRVYSHPLKTQQPNQIPEGKRCTAEMGAHIIVGFDHGNPLSILIRGQLALPYHALTNDSAIHDTDGGLVDEQRDAMVEKLFNDVLDRASVYRHRISAPLAIEGDRSLIEAGRDPIREGGPPISVVEREHPNQFPNLGNDEPENVPGGIDRLTGKAHMIYGSRKKEPPAMTAEAMGWKLASNVLAYQDLNLDVVAKASKNPTLGAAMDEAVKQYQFLLDLSPNDMRLLNWHYANLEYANAANLGKLSLGGWDQDTGNEFEGAHAQVVGGYQQVPRGILHCPTPLDLRTKKAVKKVTYNMYSGSAGSAVAKVATEDGTIIDADHVVLTTPLGVLKENTLQFDPPLPDWKKGPINRLGFGVLNKIVLVYDEPFWPIDQDMFGLLREPDIVDSLDQEDYVANRGRFYFFWNCIKTSGRPVLISLMAGDAACEAEKRTDADLVAEVTQELIKIFKEKVIPKPAETIVTRWGLDRFARGTYSYVGAEYMPGDYEAMAAPVGNLHFAGEATCATHPATVHGAYISGLRAASEVIDDLLGPIELPSPLVPWPVQQPVSGTHRSNETTPAKRKASSVPKSPNEPKIPNIAPAPVQTPDTTRNARLEAFESDILSAIYAELNLRPSPPQSTRPNAFLLYTSEKWDDCKARVEEERRTALAANPGLSLRSSGNDIRTRMGHEWNTLPEDSKRPYIDQAKKIKAANAENAKSFQARLAAWDNEAMRVRREYVESHPGVLTPEEEVNMWKALGVYGDLYGAGERKAKKLSGYADKFDVV